MTGYYLIVLDLVSESPVAVQLVTKIGRDWVSNLALLIPTQLPLLKQQGAPIGSLRTSGWKQPRALHFLRPHGTKRPMIQLSFHLCWVSLLLSFQVLLFPLLLGFLGLVTVSSSGCPKATDDLNSCSAGSGNPITSAFAFFVFPSSCLFSSSANIFWLFGAFNLSISLFLQVMLWVTGGNPTINASHPLQPGVSSYVPSSFSRSFFLTYNCLGPPSPTAGVSRCVGCVASGNAMYYLDLRLPLDRNYAGTMAELWQNYGWTMQELCRNYAGTMAELCRNYTGTMQELCRNYSSWKTQNWLDLTSNMKVPRKLQTWYHIW